MVKGEKVEGNRILVFGDLHLSAVYTGQHKDYIYECFYNMDKILDICKKEEPAAVFFLGDLIGVNETNIKDHRFLMRVMMFFETINSLTNNHVYAVKGNHDIGDFSDFDLLLGLRLIKNPEYVDFYADGSFEVRFHLVNYGCEHNKLNITKEDDLASNVVLGHNNYYIDGVTTWYSEKNSVLISRLTNMADVELIISGHIHEPSSEVLYTNIEGSQAETGILYTGSPSRTSERIDDCWYVSFSYTEDSTSYDVHSFGLIPVEEAFFDKEEIIDEGTLIEQEKQEKLIELVKDIMEGRITSGDLNHQIEIVPGFSDKVKNLAKDYLKKAGSE